MARYDMLNKLCACKRNIALQGEIIGPKINGNRHSKNDIEFYLFNVYDLDRKCYVDWDEVELVAKEFGLQTVRVVYRGVFKTDWTLPKLLKLADEQVYEGGSKAEGLVLKTNGGDSRLSVKIISNKFLMKHGL
jgi:ATP-dependent RNA circularization protein (DNA/RNA ligase family)